MTAIIDVYGRHMDIPGKSTWVQSNPESKSNPWPIQDHTQVSTSNPPALFKCPHPNTNSNLTYHPPSSPVENNYSILCVSRGCESKIPSFFLPFARGRECPNLIPTRNHSCQSLQGVCVPILVTPSTVGARGQELGSIVVVYLSKSFTGLLWRGSD